MEMGVSNFGGHSDIISRFHRIVLERLLSSSTVTPLSFHVSSPKTETGIDYGYKNEPSFMEHTKGRTTEDTLYPSQNTPSVLVYVTVNHLDE